MLYTFKATSSQRFQPGFTLIELLFVLSVLAVLLSLAMPNLRGSIARNQLLGQASELAGAMALARSEAVTRGMQAGLCASANGTTCSGSNSDWDKYMLVFVDRDRGSDFDNNEPLLKSYDAHSEVSQTASASAFYFNESGFSTLNATSNVEVCHDNLSESDRCRVVSIAPTGIVTVRPISKKPI